MWRGILTVIAAGITLAATLAPSGGADAARKRLPWIHVTSTDIARSGVIKEEQVTNFPGFGCHGGNISPEIKWEHAPADTKSYAVTLFDPDAPTGSGFWHWVIFNIPATVHELPRNAGDLKAGLAPPGSVQARTDFGVAGYNGPCPPPGDKPHRYRVTVFAVDVPHLDGDENTPAAVIGFELHFHTIVKGELIGRYGRVK